MKKNSRKIAWTPSVDAFRNHMSRLSASIGEKCICAACLCICTTQLPMSLMPDPLCVNLSSVRCSRRRLSPKRARLFLSAIRHCLLRTKTHTQTHMLTITMPWHGLSSFSSRLSLILACTLVRVLARLLHHGPAIRLHTVVSDWQPSAARRAYTNFSSV